jgi:hypothetical protein
LQNLLCTLLKFSYGMRTHQNTITSLHLLL